MVISPIVYRLDRRRHLYVPTKKREKRKEQHFVRLVVVNQTAIAAGQEKIVWSLQRRIFVFGFAFVYSQP